MTSFRLASVPAGPTALPDPFAAIDGSSPAIRTLKQHMRCVADDGNVTVLLLGESGTGKERVARAIHDASPRRRAPFVIVNCAGLTTTLVEDELFGHVRGAFTGAVHDRAGPFERAAGGTIFLDEVGDLAIELQMKLLRALQERTVLRLGGRHEVAFDVRVIAATHVDLADARARGRFRDDLYFRLRVYEVRVPPLRQRGAADIVELADAIAARLAGRRGRQPPAVDPRVQELFARHRWPGNVRELENTIERMIVAAGHARVLGVEHLPDDWQRRTIAVPGARLDLAGEDEARTRDDCAVAAPGEQQVVAALEASGFNRQRAAGVLGLSRHQLYRLERRCPGLALAIAARRGLATGDRR
jgi:Nif-specific regulatory protein